MSRYNTRKQRLIKRVLPSFLKDNYQDRINDQILRDWEKNGKPLPPPHLVKVRTVEKVQKKSGLLTLVETGTFMGDMIDAQLDNFNQIYSIELSESLYKKALEKYKEVEKVILLQGDSGIVLKELVPKLEGACIFWLDGHYSGGTTAKGEKICPIFAELDAILESPFEHIILIDDSRLFVGKDDYPTIDELKAYFHKKNFNLPFEIEDDTIVMKLKNEEAI